MSPRRPTWRSVALPAEHGSWSLVLEPLVLGLLAAPSIGGLLLALAALCAFLLYRPAKLGLSDRRRGRRYPRTVLAERFAAGFGAAAVALAAGGVALAGAIALWPAAIALPFAAAYVLLDLRPGRALAAEIAAPLAFGATAAVVALAGGTSTLLAAALWLAAVARALPAVLYVRARLRAERQESWRAAPALAAHVVALAAIGAPVAGGVLGAPAAVAYALLLARAGVGLSPWRRPATARRVGVTEIAWGVVTVLLVAWGARAG